MRWYARGIEIGAGYQIGLWKQRIYSVILGVYMVAMLPYVLLGPWYALYVSVAVGYVLSKGLHLALWRHW